MQACHEHYPNAAATSVDLAGLMEPEPLLTLEPEPRKGGASAHRLASKSALSRQRLAEKPLHLDAAERARAPEG